MITFTQYTSSSFSTSAGIDFSVSGISYDANGNLLTMKQMGLKGTTSALVDDFSYTYAGGGTGSGTMSNRLLNVKDAVSDPQTILGDFRYSAAYTTSLGGSGKSGTTVDYGYDDNGNLTSDKNKDISSIAYNYLNLPGSITVTNKGTVSYVYDAGGNKLQKITIDNSTAGKTVTTTTNYLGSFVAENRTTTPADANNPDYVNQVQYCSTAEGRIRQPVGKGTCLDYFIKDHLGNVRMVLMDELKQENFPSVTFEDENVASKSLLFDNVDKNRTERPQGFYDAETAGTKVQMLRKTSTDASVGGAFQIVAGRRCFAPEA